VIVKGGVTKNGNLQDFLRGFGRDFAPRRSSPATGGVARYLNKKEEKA
jgi:hypothetical protein